MTHTKRITSFAFAAVPLVALVVAGCGGGSSDSAAPSAAAAPSASKSAGTRTATVRVANSGLGKILVDSHGRTLYLFKKDTGTKSTCSGACAQAWPPLQVSGKPAVGSGARSSLVGTTTRSDGSRQVTYNGHPLYTFQGDSKRGDTKGEGVVAFGAAWFVVSPAGKQITGKAASSARSAGHSGSAKPAPAPAARPTPPPAAKPAPKPTPPPAAKPAPKPTPPPAAKPKPKKASPPSNSSIPQNNGGDQDSDNNGGPDDGDGGI